jgi:hypothetical protein
MELNGKKVAFGVDSKSIISRTAAAYILRQGGLLAGDYEEEFVKKITQRHSFRILSSSWGRP